jgi:hypothetical protein
MFTLGMKNIVITLTGFRERETIVWVLLLFIYAYKLNLRCLISVTSMFPFLFREKLRS